MSKVYIPEGYKSPLTIYEMQRAIEFIKKHFQYSLSRELNLKRVSAPLFVDAASGLNDNLNGVERPVGFDIPSSKKDGEIVHSLAKWKRFALKKYDFYEGKGLYTDMNAVRRDEELDNIHSAYVDQWDWERIIGREDRNIEFLKETVQKIVNAICETWGQLKNEFPVLTTKFEREVTFITAQELEDKYPNLSPKEREDAIVKEHKTVFVMKIGGKLNSGKPHDGRAPDYDDWELNGDILFWNDLLGIAYEVSSMGIRVDESALKKQLKDAGCEQRSELPFHKMLLNGELPLTMGGGIGQSRLCMLMIGTAHIGEVHASLWDDETMEAFEKRGITLL